MQLPINNQSDNPSNKVIIKYPSPQRQAYPSATFTLQIYFQIRFVNEGSEEARLSGDNLTAREDLKTDTLMASRNKREKKSTREDGGARGSLRSECQHPGRGCLSSSCCEALEMFPLKCLWTFPLSPFQAFTPPRRLLPRCLAHLDSCNAAPCLPARVPSELSSTDRPPAD